MSTSIAEKDCDAKSISWFELIIVTPRRPVKSAAILFLLSLSAGSSLIIKWAIKLVKRGNKPHKIDEILEKIYCVAQYVIPYDKLKFKRPNDKYNFIAWEEVGIDNFLYNIYM